jgi:hypothetical protein
VRWGSFSILAVALTAIWMLNYSAAVDYSKIITIEPGKYASGVPVLLSKLFEATFSALNEPQNIFISSGNRVIRILSQVTYYGLAETAGKRSAAANSKRCQNG